MHELARFRDPRPARLMVQVLTARGIAAEVEEQGGEAVLWLHHTDQLDEARRLLDEFIANPLAPRFQQDAWQSSEPVALGEGQPPLVTGQWWASLGPVVRLVFIASVLVFASQWLWGDKLYQALFFPPQLADLASQPWRLFTPMLLHFNWLHIIFNLLWWVELGRIIERFQSSWQLLLITLVTAAISNISQFFFTGPDFGGLSGVVYALLGYLWLYGKVNPAAGYQLRKEIVVLMLVWLVVCMTGLVGPVANAAHAAGLLSGCALGAATGWWRRSRHYRD
ncbi:MAG: rhomboid family intramembrane serine protease [Alcanivorax sp.]|nr:rhomboid family intramembrane serine protease [Alcanivorax sp.]